MEAPTPLTQEGIPNPHRENQSPDALDASGAHDASGTHNAHPEEAAERDNPQEDSAMEDTPHAEVEMASTQNTEPRTTRSQQKKRAAESQLEKDTSEETVERASKNSAVAKRPVSETKTAKSKKASAQALEITDPKRSTKRKILATDKGPQEPGGSNQDRSPVEDVNLESEKSRNKGKQREKQGQHNGGIEAAIIKEQEKVRLATKERDKMWGRIAKAVDIAMAAEAPGKIQQKQVDYILKAIMDCALPEGPVERPSQEAKVVEDNAIPSPSIPKPVWPKTPNPPQTKPGPKAPSKPTLQSPLNGNRADSRLMIRLGETSPHRNEHPFLLQKKANAALPPHITVGKVAHVKTGIALVPANGTMLQQLEECGPKLAQMFGACRAEPNEKWAKYMVRDIPRRIRTLDGLTDVSIAIAEEAFEMATGMKPEWGRWTIVKDKEEEEIVEGNMIFAVRPQNISSIPKVISILGKMRVIRALPPKETAQQCTGCGEWSHKRENCAKKARCFHCGSGKHSLQKHTCLEEECGNGATFCPHPPKCIVCAGPHLADYDKCTLRPVYSKTKGGIKKPTKAEVVQVRSQQKVLRTRIARDNQLQHEIEVKNSSNPAPPTSDFTYTHSRSSPTRRS